MQTENGRLFLGVDTSNYTTSLSLCRDGVVIKNVRRLLPVAENERGLRQSDALFFHTKALPELAEELFSDEAFDEKKLCAVGVSTSPRSAKGSYMPCFLAGISFASAAAFSHSIPLYGFSHQMGHIEAAVSSCSSPEIFENEFISFHVSGGTTEIVKCQREKDGGICCEIIGGTKDLNAGQAIDRTGVRMGLLFPCGKELDRLSSGSAAKFGKIKVSTDGFFCSLSGLENKASEMMSSGLPKEDVAAFLFEYLSTVLSKLTDNLRREYPDMPIIYAGGVMSNSRIRKNLSSHENVFFASPELSSDNACGTALLANKRYISENL